MKCNNCGAPIVLGSRFCENCGTPVSATEASGANSQTPASNVCPSCGQANSLGSRFCENCGTPLSQPEGVPGNPYGASQVSGNPYSTAGESVPVNPYSGAGAVPPTPSPYSGDAMSQSSVSSPYSGGTGFPNIGNSSQATGGMPPVPPIPPVPSASDVPPVPQAPSASQEPTVPPVPPAGTVCHGGSVPPVIPGAMSNTSGTSIPPAGDEEEIVVEKKSGNGRGVWITISIILAIAVIVLLILLLTGKKGNSYGNDDNYLYGDTAALEPDPWEVPAVEAEEPADSAVAVESSNFSDRFPHVDVYGKWNDANVNVDVYLTTYYDGTVSASGYAFYTDGGTTFTLNGSGYNDGAAVVLNLNEYNSDGTYTGEWKGRVFMSSSGLNYYGHFYDTDGSENCYFDLYAR